MAQLDHLVLPVSDVEFSAMRREVLRALAALSDRDYQRRVWELKQYPGTGFYDDLTQNINVLYDDCQVLPEPESRLWSVLLPGDELARLAAVDRVLGRMIDELGEAPDEMYLADPRWATVMTAAGRALASMILAGGFCDPESQ